MEIVQILGVMIPIIALCIPIVAILTGPLNKRMALNERREARLMYERIVMEKLDVIKTAVAMGQSTADLRELDQRLASLIGNDELAKLLDPKVPQTPAAKPELRDADLSTEIRRIGAKQHELGS
jgi:hypothetical protein